MRIPQHRLLASCTAYALMALPLLAQEGEKINEFEQLPPGGKLATIVFGLLLVVAVGVGILALMSLYSVLRPQTVRRGADTLRVSPGRTLGVGVLAALVLFGFLAILGPAAQVTGLLIVALLTWAVYLLLSGLCMVAHEIGERLQSSLQSRAAGSAVANVLWGGLILLLVGFVPFVGQLVQFVAAVLGFGVAVQVLMADRRDRKARALAAASSVAPAESESAESAPPSDASAETTRVG